MAKGIVIDHNDEEYKIHLKEVKLNRFNGAFYYSEEIVRNIIPRVKTNRNWVTVNAGKALDHSIVFIHNNKYPERYEFLKNYNDLVLVCGIPETCDKVKHLGTPVYLPLSVDVDYVKKFISPKTEEIAFAGRISKANSVIKDSNCDIISGLPREILLEEIAKYKKLYAVGRVAIEGKILGCDILPYDDRFPEPSIWEILDNKEAAKMLQQILDKIDKEV